MTGAGTTVHAYSFEAELESLPVSIRHGMRSRSLLDQTGAHRPVIAIRVEQLA